VAVAAACAAAAAAPEFRAGAAASARVRALALEDRHGGRAAIAEARFPVTRALSDAVAARVMRAYGLERGAILIRGGAPDAGAADFAAAAAEIEGVLGRALDGMEPAQIASGPEGLSVVAPDGRCRAALSVDGAIAESGCTPGEALRGRIRGVFRMAEPAHALARRGEAVDAYPVQAIGIGKRALILALGGPAPLAEFRGAASIVAMRSNDDRPLPQDAHVRDAIRLVLRLAAR
jgi:hypothetical protein